MVERLAAVLIASALSLAACGGEDAADSPVEADATTTAPSGEDAIAGDVEVTCSLERAIVTEVEGGTQTTFETDEVACSEPHNYEEISFAVPNAEASDDVEARCAEFLIQFLPPGVEVAPEPEPFEDSLVETNPGEYVEQKSSSYSSFGGEEGTYVCGVSWGVDYTVTGEQLAS